MDDSQPLDELGKFVYVKDLSEGGVSPVVLARNTKTGEQVAIKRVPRESVKHFQDYVTAGVIEHSTPRHPHVVQLREVFRSAHHLNIVMDYATGGSLFTYVQQRNRLREPLARWFCQQMVLAVDYLHRKGISNRNIRLEKILLQVVPGLPRPLVKLHYSDYNLRNVLGAEVGPYTAPETLKGQRHDHEAADVWRCGVVLYCLLVGRYPFQASDKDSATDWETALRNVKNSELYLPDSLGLTQECTDVLRQLLHADPQQRIGIAGIMTNPWFRQDLPPDALCMNDRYLSNTRTCTQSGEEMRQVVAAAAKYQGKSATQGKGAISAGEQMPQRLQRLQRTTVSSSSSDPPISTTAAPPQLPGSNTQPQPTAVAGEQSSQQQGTAVAATQGSAQPLNQLLQALEPTAAGQLQDAAAQVSATCNYQIIRQQHDQRMFGSNRSLLARCHCSNRQRTILQLPRQQLQQDPGCRDRLLPGLQAMMQLQHPHVLQVQEVLVTPQHLNVVVEECSAGRLLDYAAAQQLGALSPDACRFFFQQLVLGVHCCHSQGAAGLDIQHTLLKVTAAVPQPLVKVAPPVLTQGLPLQPTEGDFRPPCVATSSAAQQDMWACGVLLVKLLGGTITRETPSLQAAAAQPSSSSGAAARDPVQQQRTVTLLFTLPERLWEQSTGSSSGSVGARADVQLLDLLRCMLVPRAEQQYTIDEVFRHPWVQHGMTQKAKGLVLQGVSPQQQQQHSRQQPAEVEALVAAAASQHAPGQQIQQLLRCRTHSTQVALQLRVLEELRLQGIGLQHAQAQLELSASRMGSAVFGAVLKVTVEQVAQRVGFSMQCLATTLGELKQQHDLQQQQQQQQRSMAVSGHDISGNAAVLLRLCCTDVLYQAGRLQQLLHQAACMQPLTPAATLQQVQEHLLGLLVLHAGLMHTAQEVLHSLLATTAACSAVIRACRRCWRNAGARHKLLHSLSAPPLMTSAAAVRQAVCVTPLPLLADAALSVLPNQAHMVVQVLLLSAIIGIWPTQTSTSLQQQQQNAGWEVLGPVASVAELPEGLTVQQQQQLGLSGPAVQANGISSSSSSSRSCVAYAGSYNNQAVVLVGLAPLCRLPCEAEQQQPAAARRPAREQEELAARQHSGLALAGPGRVSDAGVQLRRVLYDLQCSEQQWLSGDGNNSSSSSSSSRGLFVPTRLVCLNPPLLLTVPQHSVGTLDKWIQQRADSVRAAAGGSSSTNTAFTEAWLAALPIQQVLQLLLDTAAALHVMHSHSPACMHGEVHAGFLHMLQDLSSSTAAAAESAQQQQRVSQLSLVTLLSSIAPVASYHPLLSAPECLLATGPPTPASDVYGFGVLMYQLISGWLTPPDAPGTDEHLARMQWTRNSLASTAGSASYLAALQAADRGRSSPYAGHLLTQAVLAGLPAGYQALMVSCLNRKPPERPCAAQLVTQVQLMLSAGST